MAAMLLEIKSRMLLPRPPRGARRAEDPRAELVRRLIEYEQMKARRGKARTKCRRPERDFEWVTVWFAEKVAERLPEVSLHDLQLAWLAYHEAGPATTASPMSAARSCRCAST
jgi:segregation and condensation protein A